MYILSHKIEQWFLCLRRHISLYYSRDGLVSIYIKIIRNVTKKSDPVKNKPNMLFLSICSVLKVNIQIEPCKHFSTLYKT